MFLQGKSPGSNFRCAPICPVFAALVQLVMDKLRSIIESDFSKQTIDLSNDQWHRVIPNQAGWYYLETDAPLEVFLQLESPPSEYINEDGEEKKCRNYDISSRSETLVTGLETDGIIIDRAGTRPVYSGMAINLLNRAREHTFGHKGTAGLALANYRELAEYTWTFRYMENNLQYSSKKHRNIILKLGEQIWRSNNGWPILCSS